MAVLTADAHRKRAEDHEKLGQTLLEVTHEWAAVSLFYSAYHHVKAALLEDPVFDDVGALHALSTLLTPDDRRVSMHRARKGSQRLGVNEIVTVLYRPVSPRYEMLHQMSIDVRYQHGLRRGAIDALPSVYGDFAAAVTNGDLRYGA